VGAESGLCIEAGGDFGKVPRAETDLRDQAISRQIRTPCSPQSGNFVAEIEKPIRVIFAASLHFVAKKRRRIG
jgi:hypothetical protein